MLPKETTLLIVDDDNDLRDELIFIFTDKSFRVLNASNGNEALKIAKSNPIDLVLSDIRMPGGDGIELLKKLREIDPKVPVVIFVTGFADISSADALSLGAHRVFEKPFKLKEVVEEVTRIAASLSLRP